MLCYVRTSGDCHTMHLDLGGVFAFGQPESVTYLNLRCYSAEGEGLGGGTGGVV